MGKISFCKKGKIKSKSFSQAIGFLCPIRLENARGEVSLLGSHYLMKKNMNPFSERMLKKNRRGLCNIKPIQSKLHPTQGLFDAISKLAVAMQPSDWGYSEWLAGHSSHSPWHGGAGQCLLPLTLFMTAPVTPLALMGG